ncbi:MAG TPA: A24 family peptidase [Acidimicrobiales bacterium]
MTQWALPVLAAVSGGVAGALVRVYGSSPRTMRLWWLAALGAATAAVLGASWSSTPVAVAVAGCGLAAAAVIDAVETRIPARLAHGTTACSALALVVGAWWSSDWAPAWTAAGWTAGIVVLFLALWLVGGMGYGDVRLAASTVTASVSGAAGAVTLLSGAFAAAGVTAAVQGWGRRSQSAASGRPRGERDQRGEGGRLGDGRHVPFGPALAAGWLLAVVLT